MANAQAAMTALGDPTRQRIVEKLAAGPLSVGAVANGMGVSRPAVSQHLRVLKEAGLVTETAIGTRRIYRIDWLDSHWGAALDAFAAFVDREGGR